LNESVQASTVLGIGFACACVGTFFASYLSSKLRSRKKALIVFYAILFVFLSKYLLLPPASITEFYVLNCLFGLSQCLWMVGVNVAAEQVGTNICATVATTTPNFVRGLAITMNIAFGMMKPDFGAMTAVTIIGVVVFALSLWGWFSIDENYGKSLEYEEA